LIEGYKARLGGFDFVGQYLRHAGADRPAA
jgi:hypothetical protein